jgi:aryl-alcohol dehydrogenase-like predicted oxidoreductase
LLLLLRSIKIAIGTIANLALSKNCKKEAGIPLTTLSLAWVLANSIITAPIIGASRPEQLADNFKALEIKLDADLKDKLDHISAEYRLGDALR